MIYSFSSIVIIAIWTGSQAVLLDSVYDGIEFLMLMPSVFIIPLLYKPSNEKHPFGYMQIETLFVVLKGILMTSVTVGLIANSIHIIIDGGRVVNFNIVAWFEFIACVIGIVVSLLLMRKNRNMNSPLIRAELQGWVIDSVISLGMTIAFVLPILFPYGFMLKAAPYLDSVVTIILSMIMLPVPIKTIIRGIRDLVLMPPEEDVVEEIKSITDPIIARSNCVDCQYDILKTGRKLWISAYITLDKEELSVKRFKQLQVECIAALSQRYTNFYFELLPEIAFDKQEVIKVRESMASEDKQEGDSADNAVQQEVDTEIYDS